jgi:hypothetical protein
MARILFKDSLFEELAPGSMLETDFERIVVDRGGLIFPDFFIVQFKSLVSSEEDSARADLALVERNYREWWVVEVELGNHSFESHILPQVRTLARASYGEDEGRALCGGCSELDLQSVLDMMKGRQPRVLVIVDTERKEWIHPLRRFEAELLVLQLFRSDRNEHAFRIEGHLPTIPTSVVSECSFDYLVPRFLVVHSPALLGISSGQLLNIKYRQYMTEWHRIDSQDKVWLAPTRQNPLPRGDSYRIVRGEDGSLEFQVVSRRLPRRK